ncbi:hypothetical protein D3C73_1531040 [compost metagenome]
MLLEYAEIEMDLFPTPKEITAGCALSIQFEPESLTVVKDIVKSERVEIRGIYSKEIQGYVTIDLDAE